MKSYTVFLCLLATGLCLADDKANSYMDKFLTTAFARGVRMLQIQKSIASDFTVEFEDPHPWTRKVKIRAEFQNGSVEGLEGARRESDCQARLGPESKTINCSIAFTRLVIRHDCNLKYCMNSDAIIKLGVKAEVSGPQFHLEMAEDGSTQPLFRNYVCTEKGDTEVEFSGFTDVYKWVIPNGCRHHLEEVYANHVQAMLFDVMPQKLKYSIDRVLWKNAVQLQYFQYVFLPSRGQRYTRVGHNKTKVT